MEDHHIYRRYSRWGQPFARGDTTGVNPTWGDVEDATLLREIEYWLRKNGISMS